MIKFDTIQAYLQVEQAISLINQFGKERTPFFLMVDFELAAIRIMPLAALDEDICYNFKGYSNVSLSSSFRRDDLQLNAIPFPFKSYYHQFDQVLDEIHYGNTFLINLTSKNRLKNNISLDDIFHQAKAKYKILVKDQFVSFSPETFVRILQSGKILSYPMKGTIDADSPNAKYTLLNDEKEKAEHYTIVDLIRNDLSIHAKKVEVSKFRYLDLISSTNKNLYQVSSEIQGQLEPNFHEKLGDIIFSMLPAGSVSGAPKKKTVEIIKVVEAQSRGYYTGVCGIYDGKDFDSCVLIRYIEKEGDSYYYRSGGGLTFQSEVEKEYQEMLNKIYVPTAEK